MTQNTGCGFSFPTNAPRYVPNSLYPEGYTILPLQATSFTSLFQNFYIPTPIPPLINPSMSTILPSQLESQQSCFYSHSQSQKIILAEQKKNHQHNLHQNKEKNSLEPLAFKYKVVYFDPSSAPLITSSQRFQISDTQHKVNRKKISKNSKYKQYNEIDQYQNDSNPFIIFKNRKIKKKYQKFLKDSTVQDSFLNDQSSSKVQLKYKSKEYTLIKIEDEVNQSQANIVQKQSNVQSSPSEIKKDIKN